MLPLLLFCLVPVSALFTLDQSFPSPFSLNVSQVSAITVANGVNGKEVHVSQRGLDTSPLLVFSTSGDILRLQGNSTVKSCHGLRASNSVFPSEIWCTDVGDFHVKQLDINANLIGESGLSKASNATTPDIGFDNVADAAIVPHQGIFFSDGDGGINNRIGFLDINNIKVAKYLQGSVASSSIGYFNSPHSIDFDPQSSLVVVADRGNARLQFFSVKSGSSFVFLAEWTNTTCFAGLTPWAIRVDPVRKFAAVADGDHGLLVILDYSTPAGACSVLQTIDVGIDRKPHLLDIDLATGDIYLAGVGTVPTIQRYLYQ
jgi:DNA-binding beta-propeller fold protein YncE